MTVSKNGAYSPCRHEFAYKLGTGGPTKASHLVQCEGHVCKNWDGTIKLVMEAHDEHRVQAVHHRQTPPIEASSVSNQSVSHLAALQHS